MVIRWRITRIKLIVFDVRIMCCHNFPTSDFRNFPLKRTWSFIRNLRIMSFRIKVLADQQQVILRQLLEEAVNQDDNRATIKAKHFYKSCVDIRKYTRQTLTFDKK